MADSTPALVVYGSLAPGAANAGVMDGIHGVWHEATVRGHRWWWSTGPYVGYPAFRVDHDGDEVEVLVLVSADLPDHWDRLDAFEGPGYRRVDIPVRYRDRPEDADDDRPGRAQVYEAVPGYAGEHGVGPAR